METLQPLSTMSTFPTRLATLPPSITSLITGYLDAEDLGSLWISGSRFLNSKLLGGGVQSFHFRREVIPPAVLLANRFSHLASLEIIDSQGRTKDNTWRSSLALPETLRKIKFSFDYDLSTFIEHLTSQDYHFPHLTALELSDGRVQKNQLSALRSLKAVQKLRLGARSSLPSVDPSSMPPSVTSLSLYATNINVHYESGFPDSLEALWMKLSEISADLLPFLPRHLLALHLVFERRFWDGGLRSYTAEHVAQLPRSLTHLLMSKVDFMDLEVLRALPPNLTSLQCELHYYVYFTHEHLALLPKTLTSTNLRVDDVDESNVHLLPPLLKSWTGERVHIDSKIVGRLPRGLDKLTVEFPIVGELPPGLTELHATNLWQASDFALLPKNLESIMMDGRTHIEDNAFAQLTNYPHLTSLTLVSHLVKNLDFFAHLGPSLTSLDVVSLFSSESQSLSYPLVLTAKNARSLPRNLRYLFLNELETCEPTAIQMLPKYLLCLTIKAERLDVGSVGSFPPHMEGLRLRIRETPPSGFGNHLMKHLPRTLRTLSYQLQLVNLETIVVDVITDEAISNLPPNLCSLTLPYTCDFSEQAIISAPHIPRDIEILKDSRFPSRPLQSNDWAGIRKRHFSKSLSSSLSN